MVVNVEPARALDWRAAGEATLDPAGGIEYGIRMNFRMIRFASR